MHVCSKHWSGASHHPAVQDRSGLSHSWHGSVWSKDNGAAALMCGTAVVKYTLDPLPPSKDPLVIALCAICGWLWTRFASIKQISSKRPPSWRHSEKLRLHGGLPGCKLGRSTLVQIAICSNNVRGTMPKAWGGYGGINVSTTSGRRFCPRKDMVDLAV